METKINLRSLMKLLALLIPLLILLLLSPQGSTAQTPPPTGSPGATITSGPPLPTQTIAPYPPPTQPLPTPLPTLIQPTPSSSPTPEPPLPTVVTPVIPTPVPTITATVPITTPVWSGPGLYPADEIAHLPRLTRSRGRHQPGVGGNVASGAVRLTLPPQAHGRALGLDLRQNPTYRVLRPGMVPMLLFTLDLTDEAQGTLVHRLDQTAELRINLASLLGPERDTLDLGIYHYNDTDERWERVPSQREGPDLVAQVSQFSDYTLLANYGHPWKPTAKLDAADTDLFSGGASFSIPLDVPQGTNGVMPKLSLTYSSAIPDQMNDALARKDGPWDNNSTSVQADWVGLGWSLGSLGRINQGVKEYIDGQGVRRRKFEYSIELSGVREKLVCISATGCDTPWNQALLLYTTERDTFMRIEQKNNQAYFQVWDKSGTYYRFGYNTDSRHYRGHTIGGDDIYRSDWGYSLDLVKDTHGNEMTVEYFEDTQQINGWTPVAVVAAYPARIRYSYVGGIAGGVYREIRFNEHLWVANDPKVWTGSSTWNPSSTNRTDYISSQSPSGYCNGHYCFVQRYRLDRVAMYLQLPSGLERFRKYTFDYSYGTPAWESYLREMDDDGQVNDVMTNQPKLLLTGVKEWAYSPGTPGTDNDYFTTPLFGGSASYTFEYDNATQSSLNRKHLTRITSVLGGTVNYTYGTFQTDIQGNMLSNINRNRVTTRKLNANLSPDPEIVFTYSYPTQGRYYDNPVYNDDPNNEDERLIGHDWAQVTDAAGHTVKKWFFTNQTTGLASGYPYTVSWSAADIYRWLKGRDYQTEAIHAGSGGNGIKQRGVTQYELFSTATNVRDVRVLRTASYRDPGSVITSQVNIKAFVYGAYGNVTNELECPDKANATDTCSDTTNGYIRKTTRWYGALNQADAGAVGGWRYIVDRVVIEGVDAGSGLGNWWPKVTYFSYDTDTAPTTANPQLAAPTSRGDLWYVRRIDCWGCATETSSDTAYTYDTTYGYRTGETTWDAFGTTTQTRATHSGTARTVTTEYETTLRTFVKKVSQPGNVVFEEANWDNVAYRQQAPRWVQDAHGTATRATLTLDDFGRLLEIQRPLDTGYTEKYEYDFSAARAIPKLIIRSIKRLDGAQTVTSRAFYDGLGRVVLSKSPHPDDSANAQTVATYYGSTGFSADLRGLKSAETLPYSTTNDDGTAITRPTLTASYVTNPRLIYQYDQFGALVATTRPDATQSVITPLREQRKTYTAERGADFGISNLNPNFETLGAGNCLGTWTLTAGGSGCALRADTGVEGRYAMQIAASGAVWRAEASYNYGTPVLYTNNQLTLSFLARRTAGSAGIRPVIQVSSNGSTWTNALSGTTFSLDPNASEWKLLHVPVTIPAGYTSGAAYLKIAFEVDSGTTIQVDNLRLSWADVRERSEELDGLGRLKKVEERKDVTSRIPTSYTYDPLNRVIQVTGANNQVTENDYLDPTQNRVRLNQLIVRDPDRGEWVYTYDPQGNVKEQKDARLKRVQYSYDALNRLTGKTYPDDPGMTPVSYTYDNNTAGAFRLGRRYQMVMGGENVTYTYDARGRVTTEVRFIANVNYSTSYSYNSADQVKSMTYPDGEVVNYSYNTAGQMTGATGTSAYLTSQSYDVQGRPVNVTLGNGAVSRHTYDSFTQRLSELKTDVKEGIWNGVDYTYVPYTDSRLTYGYDNFGNVTAINYYDRYNVFQAGESQTYSYDTLNRLLTVSGPYAQSFTYNDLGNITNRDSQGYAYNATRTLNYRYLGTQNIYRPHAVTSLTGSTGRFSYDLSGNMTGRGSGTLTYDAEGRLTQASGVNGNEQYKYDGDGVLYRRTITTNAPSTQFSDGFTTASLSAASWTVVGTATGNNNDGASHPSVATLQANSQVYRTGTVNDGQIVKVAFKVAATTSDARLRVETGNFGGGTYHSFGILQNDGKLYLQILRYSIEIQRSVLIEGMQANTWYWLEVEVDNAAGFRASVWKESDPGTRYEARFEMPTGLNWDFHVWSNTTTCSLDEYSEYRPGGTSSDSRIIGKHYEYDSVSNSQTKRYYASGRLLATRNIPNANPGAQTLRYIQPDHLGSSTTLTDANGVVVARERYSAFGERRRGESSTALITDQLYTDQRYNMLSGLYHYSDETSAGRFYDPLLARFVMADPITPSGSQGLNRYSYTFNNPLAFIDPDGHDAMFVGGWGSNDWEDPSSWKEWAMEYKGWSEQEWLDEFYNPWLNAADDAKRQGIMESTGIHIFDWRGCGCGDGDSKSSSLNASLEWAMGALDQQLEGMQDITIVGHSKGGNLIYNYISDPDHKHPIKNAVLTGVPISNMIATLPIGLGASSGVLNDSARRSTVVVLGHALDPVTWKTVYGGLGPRRVVYQYIKGAINRVETGIDPKWRDVGAVHAFHRNPRIAFRTMLSDFSIVGDRHARTWGVK